MDYETVKAVINAMDNSGFHLKSLILHTNNIGEQFQKLKEENVHKDFINLGTERLI